jgi:hypothetical protein
MVYSVTVKKRKRERDKMSEKSSGITVVLSPLRYVIEPGTVLQRAGNKIFEELR